MWDLFQGEWCATNLKSEWSLEFFEQPVYIYIYIYTHTYMYMYVCM